jgi:hypothetical protein
MFIDNKYVKIYFDLMSKAKSRDDVAGYTERHHVVPRCLGGSNASDNLVRLTAREHFLAHLLLIKMVGAEHRRKMAYAVICFKRKNPKHLGREVTNSKNFANVKLLLANLPVSAETLQRISTALKGKKRPKSVCDAISKAHRGKTVSVESRLKMREAKLGKILSEETKAKMSHAKRGKSFTKSHCENISKSYRKTEARSNAIREANKSKRQSCTVDGVNIFESKSALEKMLGRGKTGSRSPTFRYLEK